MGPYVRLPALLSSWLVGAVVGSAAFAALGFRGWPLAGSAVGCGVAVLLLAVRLWARSAPRSQGGGPERRPPVH